MCKQKCHHEYLVDITPEFEEAYAKRAREYNTHLVAITESAKEEMRALAKRAVEIGLDEKDFRVQIGQVSKQLHDEQDRLLEEYEAAQEVAKWAFIRSQQLIDRETGNKLPPVTTH